MKNRNFEITMDRTRGILLDFQSKFSHAAVLTNQSNNWLSFVVIEYTK